MYDYYVIEIQTNADGTSGNFVFGYADKGAAEDKYLTLRQFARQSAVHIHTILWIDKMGATVDKKVYIHPIPEPEPETEETPGEE